MRAILPISGIRLRGLIHQTYAGLYAIYYLPVVGQAAQCGLKFPVQGVDALPQLLDLRVARLPLVFILCASPLPLLGERAQTMHSLRPPACGAT
jgi:hypothetical protein